MREFCGSDFWNINVTWDTGIDGTPDFTPCFTKSIISWFPTLVLFLATLNELPKYFKSENRDIPWNFLNLTKTGLTALLVILTIIEFGFTIATDKDDIELTNIYSVDYLNITILMLTYAWSLTMLLLAKKYGIQTSPAQFLYFLAWIISGAISLRHIILRVDNLKDDYHEYDEATTDRLLIFYSFQYGLHIILFLLNFIADGQPRKYDERIKILQRPCPQINASFASILTFVWATPLLWKGFRNPITTNDLWDMDPELTSRGQVPKFDKHLGPALQKAKQKGVGQNVPSNQFSSMGKNRGSLTLKTEEEIKSVGNFSILPSMLKTFGPMFFHGAALKIFCDILTMVSPQMMNYMIGYVEHNLNAEDNPEIEKEPEWRAYFYPALILVATMLNTIILSQYFEKMFTVGMNMRTSLISALYRKALRMTGAARKESTVGEIVNLMSVDVQRFMDLLPYLNMMWSAPFQIALCCYFMYQQLGPSTFVGVALLVLSIPLNGVIAGISRKYQIAQMKEKDTRVKMMNEILGGVKVLKLYGWEPSFIQQILDIRGKEMKVLRKAAWLNAFMSFFWTSVPFLVALMSFTTYVLIDENNILTPQKAFTTITYLSIMRMPMAVLPFVVVGLVQANVSLKRVNKYMNNEELNEEAVTHDANQKDPIVIENGNFRWDPDSPTVLEDVNVRIKRGSLTAVVGTVGSGKSSLISSTLGELEKLSGSVNVVGNIAYVPQQAWMQNATVKDNIMFGKVFNKAKYEGVIDACALRSDLKILPGGDSTEIGEKGINLSGGQKQRVSLARAVYNDAEIYLLDDPLSAVDSHVGKHIFEKVISHDGLLNDKTRVLVTHGLTYLPKCDHIIVLKEGKVSEQGSYQELVEQKGEFANFLLEYMTEVDDNELDEEIKKEFEKVLGKEEVQKRRESITLEKSPLGRDRKDSTSSLTRVGRQVSKSESIEEESKAQKSGTNVQKKEQKVGTTLIEKEGVETGSVGWDVYLFYMKALGFIGVFVSLVFQVLYQGSNIGTSFWLNIWSGDSFDLLPDAYGTYNNSILIKNATDDGRTKYLGVYLGVYGAFGFLQSLGVVVLNICLSLTTLSASGLLHQRMLNRILRSPMGFFDTTPLGRIVNRFAKDVDVCDNVLYNTIRTFLSTFTNFVGTVVLICVLIPILCAVILPMGLVFYFIQRIYIGTARQLKRLESVSRSPIYSHFGETLNGASTIRAFGLQNKFILESEAKVDANQVCYYPSYISNRWLTIFLEIIGNFFTFAASLFAVTSTGIESSEVGLIISYSLTLTQVLNWLVRQAADIENNIVAVERIKEYSEIPNEADWTTVAPPPPTWPPHGSVQFKQYAMRYREGLDLVLKSVDANIKGGEKIGIVGRTGAGKSSLTVALFRLVEPANGSIIIDGIDITKIGLHELRTKLTIIPQDPVLFSGTLRVNLDPFEHHSDEDIWNALNLAHLHDFVTSLEAGLQHEVAEGGENLSVGQRQLVCLARALLRKTKVLILDEATAAVDLETDDLIQATIRSEFKDCTVLTIAHRLNTIMDYDRIMVLDKGVIAEFASPNTLVEDQNSIFHSMVKDAGLA